MKHKKNKRKQKKNLRMVAGKKSPRPAKKPTATETPPPVMDTDLGVQLVIGRDSASNPVQFVVKHLDCADLPFLEDELETKLASLSLPGGKNATALIDLGGQVKKLVEDFLKGFGLAAGVNVTTLLESSQPPTKETLPETAADTEEPKHPAISQQMPDYGQLINLFVDLGSTNSKWIVAHADKNGKSGGFIQIVLARPTREVCGQYGIDYDKESAYRILENEPPETFTKWLGEAVLGFTMRMQKEFRANIMKLKWAFPLIEYAAMLDFHKVSKEVTNTLQSFGFKGHFELLPEGEALYYMFNDRVRELASASQKEEQENARRIEQENRNKRFNVEEQRKSAASKQEREREAQAWKKKHLIKRWFCDPEVTTPLYQAQHRTEYLGRENALQAFRVTGAMANGKFNLLIVDAGGTTLDYYFKPISGTHSSGSFEAGGQTVTERLAKELSIPPEVAEKRKLELSKAQKNEALRKATDATYRKALEKIASVVKGHQPLCVVASGLGMLNMQLRKLLKETIGLPEDQMLMFSPDIAKLFPGSKTSEYQDIQTFMDIVEGIVEGGPKNGMPWPGADVCGGLYFLTEKNKTGGWL